MLRGRAQAKLDVKGRLKLPANFRNAIEPNWGREFFVTSLLEPSVRIYPLDVYARIEKTLAKNAKFGSALHRVSTHLNYHGQQTSMDGQGRILIQPSLRQLAQLEGDVTILGQQNYLEVWDFQSFEARMAETPLTPEDLDQLAELEL